MNLYQQYADTMRKIADINYAGAVLSWDNEVYLPKEGMQFRSRQLATLMGISHELFTDKKFGKILTELSDVDLTRKEKRNVLLTKEVYEREKKFSSAFVQEKSMAISHAYHSWVEAKSKNDFSLYEKPLDKIFEIIRKEISITSYKDHAYNAMIHLYERGMTVKKLDEVFLQVKKELIPFLNTIATKKQSNHDFLHMHYEKDKQWAFGLGLLKQMGYNFNRGRQDVSPHPFTISFNPLDVRVTTRVDENDLSNMTWSCIHEGGHALYEQGLSTEDYGLPVGSAASLAIHESQSRLWENNVGRSKAYWKHNYPKLKKVFHANLKNVSLDQFYKAINGVRSNLIRTESDELHYHIHVMIRYEIEKEIVSSNITAREVRDLWNEKYKAYFGLKVKKDSEGILQDVHWSHGSIGYFPTYSLGSFYAAQFFSHAQLAIPNLQTNIEKGETGELLNWLRNNIHKHGAMYDAEVLCKKVTGEKLNFQYFMAYVKGKY